MCGPIALGIAGLALGAAGATTSVVGQNQAASRQNQYALAQARAADDQRRRNAEIANQDAQRTSDQNNLRLQEEERLAAQQAQRNQRDGAQARSTLATSAGENNVSGLSVNALLADFYRQEANNASILDQNILFKRNQTAFNNETQFIRAQNTVNSMPEPLPFFQQGQSALGSVFQIGSAGFGGAIGGLNLGASYNNYAASKAANSSGGEG